MRKTINHRKHLVTGISGKKNFLALTFLKTKSSDKLTLMMQVLQVFSSYHIKIENIPTSLDTFCVVVEKNAVEEKYYDLIADLKGISGIQTIDEDEDLALLAVVGGNMVNKPKSSGTIIEVLGDAGINIKLIDQGLEEYNIILGISNRDFNKAIKALYDRFAHEKIEE